jgi:hypothetical protein
MRRTLALLLLTLTIAGPAAAQTTAALLDTLQHSAFNFFWNEANPTNGLIRDRNNGSTLASIASVGFGLSAIPIGVDHGWITRATTSSTSTRPRATTRMWSCPRSTPGCCSRA